MMELEWTNAWTLAVLFGLGWLVLSGAVALALGRVLGRAKEAGRRERDELSVSDENTTLKRDGMEPEALEQQVRIESVSRASGTRLKPVCVDEVEPHRRVS